MTPSITVTEQQVIDALKTLHDPEIPVNVYDLGLIYGIGINSGKHVVISMTLTNPNCPVADKLPQDVASIVRDVPGVESVDIKLVFDPPWTKDQMSDAAMLELGLF